MRIDLVTLDVEHMEPRLEVLISKGLDGISKANIG